jgi:hypothetical protein
MSNTTTTPDHIGQQYDEAVVQKHSQALYWPISICNVTRLLFRKRKQIFANQSVTDELKPNSVDHIEKFSVSGSECRTGGFGDYLSVEASGTESFDLGRRCRRRSAADATVSPLTTVAYAGDSYRKNRSSSA